MIMGMHNNGDERNDVQLSASQKERKLHFKMIYF